MPSLATRAAASISASAGFSGSGTVVSAEGSDRLVVAGLDGFADDWFAHRRADLDERRSGGRTERVTSFRHTTAGTVVALWREGRLEAAAGDAFDIVAGCDKRFATCKAKFANPAQFPRLSASAGQ